MTGAATVGGKRTRRGGLIRAFWGAAIAGALLFSLAWASGNPSKSAPKKTTAPRKTSLKSAPRTTAKKTSSKKRRYRKERFRARLARLKLQPDRVREIQLALIAHGYLSQDPSGQWDDATRSAMRRFQQDHGFPSTGMPEAKSLMKLGLGPHPLPEDLDPTAQAQSSRGAAGSASAAPPFSTPAVTPPPQ